MRGTVKWFNNARGYGFITSDDGNDYFIHYSNIQMKDFRTLDEGDIVEFEIKQDENGRKQAVNVKPILTIKMVSYELKKKKLCLCECVEDKHKLLIADDEKQELVVDKGMSLIEAAAFAGIDVEGLA